MGDNPAEMQLRIRTWYQRAAAQRKDFIIAPVGDAWELNYKNPNALRLHRSDNSHPQFAGSYLAALVIYATIYHPPKLELSYRGNLTEAEAKHLQNLASRQRPDAKNETSALPNDRLSLIVSDQSYMQ